MAIVNPSRYLQAGTYTAQNDRLHGVSALYTHQASDTTGNFHARAGILSWGIGGGAAFAINSSPVWSATVGPFAFLVENDFAANAGDYVVIKTGNDVVTFTASSPTLNRIDTIAVQVVDAFYSGAVSEGRLVVVQGVATSGTAVAPTLPPSCEAIADFLIAAGSTAPVISLDRRARSGVQGSIIPLGAVQFADPGAFSGETHYYEPLGTFRHWRAGSINAWRAFGGMLARGGALLATSWSLADGQEGNAAQVSLNDPGGIWTAYAAMQMEYSWTNGARVDLGVTRNGINNGTLFGTALPVLSHPSFPVSFGSMSGVISSPLTGTQNIYFNIIRVFGGATVVTATGFNFRCSALQLLLRAP